LQLQVGECYNNTTTTTTTAATTANDDEGNSTMELEMITEQQVLKQTSLAHVLHSIFISIFFNAVMKFDRFKKVRIK